MLVNPLNDPNVLKTDLRLTNPFSPKKKNRFIECEKWRKEFGVDELLRTFSYDEKPKVSEYYPQYYHKTDKVSISKFFCFLGKGGGGEGGEGGNWISRKS